MYKRLGQQGLLYEAIVHEIEQMVLSGELKVGDSLPSERELAIRFSVSRTAVREAMKVLAQKQLVVVLHGKGAVVVHPSLDTVIASLGLLLKLGMATPLQLAELRRGLEPEMAALAAARATPERIEAMEELFRKHEESRDDWESMVALDIAFHHQISEAAQNGVAKAVLSSIQELFHDTVVSGYRVQGAIDRSFFYHRKVLDAVKARDPEAARHWMWSHMDDLAKGLGQPVAETTPS